jgi:nucleotide-binding universal stress UspA family protein
MPVFKAEIQGVATKSVLDRESGAVSLECRISLIARTGDPNELEERLLRHVGKLMSATLEPEQMEFDAVIGKAQAEAIKDGGDFSEDETVPSAGSVEADRMRQLAEQDAAEAEAEAPEPVAAD